MRGTVVINSVKKKVTLEALDRVRSIPKAHVSPGEIIYCDWALLKCNPSPILYVFRHAILASYHLDVSFNVC